MERSVPPTPQGHHHEEVAASPGKVPNHHPSGMDAQRTRLQPRARDRDRKRHRW